MLEKIRRKDKVKHVKMNVVQKLLQHQMEMNSNSNNPCTLHPKSDLIPCCDCPIFQLCYKHEWEREYIKSNKDSYNTSKRRNRKEEKRKMKFDIMESHEDKENIYPCNPFDFSCPERDNCNEGKNCPWKEEE